MGYTTLPALKSYGDLDDSSDVLLNFLILSASAIIDNETHRKFEVADETAQTFSRVRGVPTRVRGNTLWFHEELALEASAITDSPTVVYLPESGAPYYAMVLTEGAWAYPTVTVTGYWGHSKVAPAPIEMACLRLCKWLYDMGDGTSNISAIVTPEGQVLLPEGIPSDVLTILAPYKKVVLS